MNDKKETAFDKFKKEVMNEFADLKKSAKPSKGEPKSKDDFKLLFEQNEDRLKKAEDKLNGIEKLFSDFKETIVPDSDFDLYDFLFKP